VLINGEQVNSDEVDELKREQEALRQQLRDIKRAKWIKKAGKIGDLSGYFKN
jgi:hypothetical protein